ncbi:unnamed protein product [Amoebophrya sp. A120]|nr:unnamed protein product [Amoebophrya sp. A120]|eukprot:GSA120T00004996001.1
MVGRALCVIFRGCASFAGPYFPCDGPGPSPRAYLFARPASLACSGNASRPAAGGAKHALAPALWRVALPWVAAKQGARMFLGSVAARPAPSHGAAQCGGALLAAPGPRGCSSGFPWFHFQSDCPYHPRPLLPQSCFRPGACLAEATLAGSGVGSVRVERFSASRDTHARWDYQMTTDNPAAMF